MLIQGLYAKLHLNFNLSNHSNVLLFNSNQLSSDSPLNATMVDFNLLFIHYYSN